MACPTLPAPPGRVVLDWRHARIGPLAPCVLCGRPALCRSPAKDVPCHKGCAEAWITAHARQRGRPGPAHPPPTPPPGGGRVTASGSSTTSRSAPTAASHDISSAERTGDGTTETAPHLRRLRRGLAAGLHHRDSDPHRAPAHLAVLGAENPTPGECLARSGPPLALVPDLRHRPARRRAGRSGPRCISPRPGPAHHPRRPDPATLRRR